MGKLLKNIDNGFEKVTVWILVCAVLTMLFFSVLTIVLRWFGTGLMWVEPFVRHLVFMSTFLGGILATGRGTHIGIDVGTKFLETKGFYFIVKQTQRIIYIASLLTMTWLAFASLAFVKQELEFGKNSFLGITSGQLVTMIPIGFGLIAFRFLLKLSMTFFNYDRGLH